MIVAQSKPFYREKTIICRVLFFSWCLSFDRYASKWLSKVVVDSRNQQEPYLWKKWTRRFHQRCLKHPSLSSPIYCKYYTVDHIWYNRQPSFHYHWDHIRYHRKMNSTPQWNSFLLDLLIKCIHLKWMLAIFAKRYLLTLQETLLIQRKIDHQCTI